MLWDFFVYTNAWEQSAYDIAMYESWLDAWRINQLQDNSLFLQSGWPEEAFEQHKWLMTWALDTFGNGAKNLRIPGMKEYIHDVLGSVKQEDGTGTDGLLIRYFNGEFDTDTLASMTKSSWNDLSERRGKLKQLTAHRASLGIEQLELQKQCENFRAEMDENDPSICKVYDEQFVRCNSTGGLSSYVCPEALNGLDGRYAGKTARYLSFNTAVSTPNLLVRRDEFIACTGGEIFFGEASDVFTDPLEDLGTQSVEGTNLYDGYLISYSHFPEASALGKLETLNERIEKSNLGWFDVYPMVREVSGYQVDQIKNIDFLPYDGDFLLPIIRMDILEKYNLSEPQTWEELRDVVVQLNGKDFNGDGEPDYGFCQFPKIGAGSMDTWWPEIFFSTWATMSQRQGSQDSVFFDLETFEPLVDGVGFKEASRIWKDLWFAGTGDCGSLYMEGRCAIGYGPPGCWKGVFKNGVRRTNGSTTLWEATMADGSYAMPKRVKPFGSYKVTNDRGQLEECNVDLCPHGEHVDPKNISSPYINRAPYFWSGGLGT
eukprot:gene10348-12237_t